MPSTSSRPSSRSRVSLFPPPARAPSPAAGPTCACRCERCCSPMASACRSTTPPGPYTDPAADIDVRRGLPGVRDAWIAERGDTESYEGRLHLALDDGATHADRDAQRIAELRAGAAAPPAHATPRQVRRQRDADALRAPRHRHARDGIRRLARERPPRMDGRVPRRRSAREAPGRQPHGRPHPEDHHARVRSRRSGARPRHHPRQHQPPRESSRWRSAATSW